MNSALQRNKKKRKSLRKKALTSFNDIAAINLVVKSHYDTIYEETLPTICNEAGVNLPHEIPSLRTSFSSLGAVSDEKDYYFDSTEKSQHCAKLFFENVIKTSKHCAFLKNNNKENASNKAPRCVSFVTATLNSENTSENTIESERKLCFVVLSGSEKNKADREKLKEAIRISVQKMGNETIFGHKFEFLDPSTETFSEILNHINMRLDPDIAPSTKPCAEKRYVSAILGLDHDVRVTGVSNYGLHLFDLEEDDIDSKTKYPDNAMRSLKLEVAEKSYSIPEIPCCEDCKKNKLSSLLIMSHFQRNKDVAERDVKDLSNLTSVVELSEMTNQYLKNPDDCASISGTRHKMTFPSWPSSRASSVTRSRTASFESHASQTSSDGLSIRFEDLKLSQDSTDSIIVEKTRQNKVKASSSTSQENASFEKLMSDLQEDTQQSKKKVHAGFFQATSSSLQTSKEEEKLEKKAKEKQEKNKLQSN